MSDSTRPASDLDLPPGTYPGDEVLVRDLRISDLGDLVRIDKEITGRDRRGYYEKRLPASLMDTGIHVSLAAELDGIMVGFLIGSVYHGEYGRLEAVGSIDTIAVLPGFQKRGVARALLAQLRRNLKALHVEKVQTEVGWDQVSLLHFMQREGFRPAARLCLELAP